MNLQKLDIQDELWDAIIKEVVAAVGASSMQDMGKVMAELKPKIQGRAEMGLVSQKVKAAISG